MANAKRFLHDRDKAPSKYSLDEGKELNLFAALVVMRRHIVEIDGKNVEQDQILLVNDQHGELVNVKIPGGMGNEVDLHFESWIRVIEELLDEYKYHPMRKKKSLAYEAKTARTVSQRSALREFLEETTFWLDCDFLMLHTQQKPKKANGIHIHNEYITQDFFMSVDSRLDNSRRAITEGKRPADKDVLSYVWMSLEEARTKIFFTHQQALDKAIMSWNQDLMVVEKEITFVTHEEQLRMKYADMLKEYDAKTAKVNA